MSSVSGAADSHQSEESCAENPTIFGSIIRGELPCKRVFEDADTLAFHDIHPQSAVHILVIPKRYIPSLDDASSDDALLLGRLLLTAQRIAKQQRLDGYQLKIHTGAGGGQEVFHLHVHLLGTPVSD